MGKILNLSDATKDEVPGIRKVLRIINENSGAEKIGVLLVKYNPNVTGGVHYHENRESAYIVLEGQNDEPMLPIIYSIGLDFPFPSASRGPPPFIHSITRGPVSRNNNVTISVSASDEGTGISDRTYIYYSINGGASWDQVLLTGGTWWNSYLGEPLGLYYPILSSIEPETYEGEIPGFPAGTEVLFKVYLEDYAANVDHVDKGNWLWSQTYSYIVPGIGELAEVTKQFNQKTEKASQHGGNLGCR